MKPVHAFGALLCALSLTAACTPRTGAPAPSAEKLVGPSPVEPPAPLSSTADGAGGAQDLAEVPAEFRGRWDAGPNACRDEASDGRLTIAAKRVDFYESGGPVTGVTRNGPREVAIATTLSGEGETWTDLTTFRLSTDGKSLTDISDPAEQQPFTRVRCPG